MDYGKQIEEAVVKFYEKNTKDPRFIVMDEESYEEFNKAYTPVERISTVNGEETILEPMKLSKFVCGTNAKPVELEIISVKAGVKLLAVAG